MPTESPTSSTEKTPVAVETTKQSALSMSALSFIALFILLIGSLVLWALAKKEIRYEAEVLFEQELVNLERLTYARLLNYEALLKSYQGLSLSSTEVTSDEWQTYTDNLELESLYSAAAALYVIEPVPLGEGLSTDNTVSSPSAQPVLSLQTSASESAGYRIAYWHLLREGIEPTILPEQNTVLQGALQKSEASRLLTASYLFSDGERGHSIFLVEPVIDNPALPTSFIVIQLQMDEFFLRLLDTASTSSDIGFAMAQENGSGNILKTITEVSTEDPETEVDEREFVIEFGQNSWTVQATADILLALNPFQRRIPNFVLLLSVCVSFLLFIIFHIISRSRLQAVRLAEQLTEKLRLEKEIVQNTKDEIEAQKKYLELMLNNMPVGVLWLDATSSQVLFFNSAGRKLFALADSPLQSLESVATRLEKEDGSSYPFKAEIVDQVITGSKQSVSTECFLPVSANDRRAVRISAAPLAGHSQGVQSVIVVLEDITHEHTVSKMKTEFISLASHQLRTPLSAIKWFSEMLVSGDAGKLNSEQQEFMKNITDSTARMISLVNSLLNISRIESGRIIIDPEPTDVGKLVETILAELESQILEKELKLSVKIPADLPKINIDPRLISQVYLNLLTNAVKYTPEKGKIEVRLFLKGEDLVSEVQDTGLGIPENEQASIFEKFHRAQNVLKLETDGTGLGLYLAKAIVESSNGKIWFASKENEGSTFAFSLPLAGSPAKDGEVTIDGDHPNESK